jgi:phosphohistidine phosphatase
MQLVLIRHAIAEDRETFASTGRPDTLRPLTKQGRWKMERVAKGLRRAVRSIDLLASSPLLRATETAAIVSAAYHGVDVSSVPAFAPDALPEPALEWLRRHRSFGTVAVVGHEPSLGAFATWLLTGLRESRTPLRKGGACAIQFVGAPREGEGQLLWMLPPALLRRVGE